VAGETATAALCGGREGACSTWTRFWWILGEVKHPDWDVLMNRSAGIPRFAAGKHPFLKNFETICWVGSQFSRTIRSPLGHSLVPGEGRGKG
jgi:hypothetical protein